MYSAHDLRMKDNALLRRVQRIAETPKETLQLPDPPKEKKLLNGLLKVKEESFIKKEPSTRLSLYSQRDKNRRG